MNQSATISSLPTDHAACRRFTIGDAMILIAVAAFWLAMARWGGFSTGGHEGGGPLPTPPKTWGDWWNRLFGASGIVFWWLRYLHLVVLRSMPVLMVAIIVIRLRRPRPVVNDLFVQPGFLGCVSPILVAGCLAWLLPLMRAMGPSVGWPLSVWVWSVLLATPFSWLILAGSRRWASEPGWIDRSGRVVAIVWMIAVALQVVLPWELKG